MAPLAVNGKAKALRHLYYYPTLQESPRRWSGPIGPMRIARFFATGRLILSSKSGGRSFHTKVVCVSGPPIPLASRAHDHSWPKDCFSRKHLGILRTCTQRLEADATGDATLALRLSFQCGLGERR